MASGKLGECGNSFIRLFEYNTPLVLHTSSKTIGIIFRLLQVFIFVFIFAYNIGYKRGYQAVSFTTTSSTRLLTLDAAPSFAQDIQIPVFEKQSGETRIFYPTTAIMVVQNKSTCPEEPTVSFSHCNPTARDPCPLRMVSDGNGDRTGNCVPLHPSVFWFHPSVTHTCEIRGWCTQSEQIRENVVESFKVPTLTILIENEIHFPEFPSRININNHATSAALCWAFGHYYHPQFHPLCPMFKLQTIAEEAAKTPGTIPFSYEELARTGGHLSVQLMYDCNFDIRDPNKQCEVSYQFRRLDKFDPNGNMGTKIPDVNYKQANDELGMRVIVRLYGVHISIMVEGVARQFDIFTFLTRLGASAGLFAIAAVLCEILLMLACCSTEKQTRNMKYISPDSKILINL